MGLETGFSVEIWMLAGRRGAMGRKSDMVEGAEILGGKDTVDCIDWALQLPGVRRDG